MSTELGTERARATLRILRSRITSGEWPVNSKIPTEAELVEELGVGRSTVREAVRSLANLGMLEPARSRGTFVRSRNPISAVLADFVSGHSPEDLLRVRRMLEVEAAILAAEYRSAEQLSNLEAAREADLPEAQQSTTVERGTVPGQFHALLFEASGNRLLADLQAGVMSALRRAVTAGHLASGLDDETRRDDHRQILAAIRDQDPDRAAAATAAHVDRDFILAASANSADVT